MTEWENKNIHLNQIHFQVAKVCLFFDQSILLLQNLLELAKITTQFLGGYGTNLQGQQVLLNT